MKKLIVENFVSKKGNECIALGVITDTGYKKYISFDFQTIVLVSGLSPREIFTIENNSYIVIAEY
jgi:hypothetical protein